MLIKYFYDDKLAQASYLVACLASETAMVIDPARNITPYLEVAAAEGVRIDVVTETHIHADFVSGTRELAAATGAAIYLSGMGGTDWQYNFPDENVKLLSDGEHFHIGNVKVDVLHTPGHTPEHIAFVITDGATSDHPFAIFSGDSLFIGTVGRPDLLEKAAGIQNTAEQGARQQFANVQRLKEMPDYLQVLPGHGAGSACGKGLGSMPSSTLGYEKLTNPAFQFDDEAAFVAWLLADQPESPRYFARMKKVNREGPELLRNLPQAQHIKDHPEGIVTDEMLFIDTRPADDFARKHIPGTVNIPLNSARFNTYVGWYVDYEQPTFFISYRNDVQKVLNELFAIGVDHVPGYFTPEVIDLGATASVPQMTPQQVNEAGMTVLDVREPSEYKSEHIPNAIHIPMGYAPQRSDELPRDEPLAVQCGGGLRSQVVISLLQKQGFTNLVNLAGGISGWKNADLPLEKD